MNTQTELDLNNVWYALLHVQPIRKDSIVANNAYVNVVGFAEGPSQFNRMISEAVKHYKLHLIDIEDLGPYLQWRGPDSNSVMDPLANAAARSKSLRFSTFNEY